MTTLETIQPTITSHDLTLFMDETLIKPETVIESQTAHTSQQPLVSVPTLAGSVDNLLTKSVLVASHIWNTTDNKAAILGTVTLPKDISLNPIRMIMNNYAFMSFDLVVRFQFNGTPFHQGRLLINWAPLFGLTSSLQRASQLPHIQIDASTNLSQEIRIPYAHIKTVLDTYDSTPIGQLGKLTYNVLNPLQASTGAENSLNVFTYVHLENSNVYNPCLNHEAFEEQSGDQNLVSEVTSAIEGAAVVASKAGEIFALLDHPSLFLPQSDRVTQDLTHGRGGISSVTLNMGQGDRTEQPSSLFPSDKNEMDLNYILKIPSYVFTFDWLASSPHLSIIKQFAVEPLTFRNSPIANIFDPSPMAYYSHMFERWRGDIIIQLDVICNKFHRGQIGVSYIPVALDVGPDINDAMNNPQYVLDLKIMQTFRMTIPYTSNIPNKRCATALDTPPSIAPNDRTNGTIIIFVLNPLASGGSAPNSVNINVTAWVGDNFQFSFPRDFETFSAQSGVIDNATETQRMDDRNAINFASATSTLRDNSDHHNLKYLASKPSYLTHFDIVSPDNNYTKIFDFAVRPQGNAADSVTISALLPFIASNFYFYRGSMRMTLATNARSGSSAIYTVRVSYPSSQSNFIAAPAQPSFTAFSHLSNLHVKPIVTYDIPFVTNYSHIVLQTLNPTFQPPDESSIALLSYFMSGNPGPTMTLTLCRAIGDDGIFSYFCGVPRMVFTP